VLVAPLKAVLKQSRLYAALCYSNLVYSLTTFKVRVSTSNNFLLFMLIYSVVAVQNWHVPSGGLKLTLRYLNHLLLRPPVCMMTAAATTINQQQISTWNSQRHEHLKSFVIASDALSFLLNSISW
jgi:hypothetical protein